MMYIAPPLSRRLVPLLAPAVLIAALGCREDAESPTAPESGPALDITPAAALSFRQVSAGNVHTCGVTTENVAFCWGLNLFGELGDGTGADVRPVPVAVVGGLRFRQVSAGSDYSCGVTTDSLAYCWGINHSGQLGNGTISGPETCHGWPCSTTPVAVLGGHRFRRVEAGSAHVCGITGANRAFCWGANDEGQLGDHTTTPRLTPVAVGGGHLFRQVSAGGAHTCGLTPDNLAYCWGWNIKGQLGNGTRIRRLSPVAVAGGLLFRQVSAGFAHTCGRNLTNRAYCWGFNRFGQLGDGTTALRTSPVPVAAGGLRFKLLNAGLVPTCGVATDDRGYCWGFNGEGQLGDGTTTDRLRPAPVAGGYLFRQVTEGSHHSCAVTTDNRAFCWGQGGNGELGDGTSTNSLTPVAVAGPS
jgi:alpha-tubulin suppressor-like RCC1 family protein